MKKEDELTRLIADLEDSDWEVQQNAVKALVKIDDPALNDILLAILRNRGVRIGDTAMNFLLAILRNRGSKATAAARALGAIGDPRAILPLLLCYASEQEDNALQNAASTALENFKDSKAVETLIECFEFFHINRKVQVNVRSKAAELLGKLGDIRAVEPLTQQLTSNWEARRAVAEALDNLGWGPKDLSEEVNYLIAKEAWEEIVEIGEPAIEALLEARIDSLYEPPAQELVVRTLATIGEVAIEALAEDIMDYFHREAEIGKINQKTLEILLSHLEDPAPVWALVLNMVREEEPYYAEIPDYDDTRIGYGAGALLFIDLVKKHENVTEILPLLQNAMNDNNLWVRVTIARALTARANEVDDLEPIVPILLEAVDAYRETDCIQPCYLHEDIIRTVEVAARRIGNPAILIPALCIGMYEPLSHSHWRFISEGGVRFLPDVVEVLCEIGLKVSDPAPVVDVLLDIPRNEYSLEQAKDVWDKAMEMLITGLPDPSVLLSPLTDEIRHNDDMHKEWVLDTIKQIKEKLED